MQDVVAAAELTGAFEGEDVERLLDDTQAALVPGAIPTDGAARLVADVEALQPSCTMRTVSPTPASTESNAKTV